MDKSDEKKTKKKEKRLKYIRAGFITGNVYGYRVKEEYNEDGELIKGLREIIPEEAKIIIRIFEEVLKGKNTYQIIRGLNADKILSPRGKEWTQSTLNGNRKRRNGILNNELYAGYFIYNRMKFKKNPLTGKRQSFLNPKEEWEVIERFDLRIVPEELWKKVQTFRRGPIIPIESKIGPLPFQKPHSLSLSQKLKCKKCGSSFCMIRSELYGCILAHKSAACSNKRLIRVHHLESRVILILRHILTVLDHDKLWLTDIKELKKKEDEFLFYARNELSKLNPKINEIVDNLDNTENTLEIRGILLKLDQRKYLLENRIKISKITPLNFSHKEANLLLLEILDWLEDGLKEQSRLPEIVAAFKAVIDEVILSPNALDEKSLDIEVVPAWFAIVDMVGKKHADKK